MTYKKIWINSCESFYLTTLDREVYNLIMTYLHRIDPLAGTLEGVYAELKKNGIRWNPKTKAKMILYMMRFLRKIRMYDFPTNGIGGHWVMKITLWKKYPTRQPSALKIHINRYEPSDERKKKYREVRDYCDSLRGKG